MSAPRDAWLRALQSVDAARRDPALTLPVLIEAVARDHAERPALLGAGECLTYAGLVSRAQEAAAWAGERHPGATLGLLMSNRPLYVALWLGLTWAGCTVALLNPNLSGEALRHSVAAAACVAVIAEPALRARAEACGVELLDPAEAAGPGPVRLAAPAPGATALLLFTSGTTGLPKAARVTHARMLEWALWFAGMMELGAEDRVFDCLPLYHSTGGIVAIGAALARGASVVVAPAFSASRFWDEVVRNGCTVFFYIGELCRYLALAGPHPQERGHRLRLAVGNGLQAGVWERFADRFAIPRILEFYAATEGNIALYNCEGKPGAIGRVPPYLRARFPLVLIRVDPESAAPCRGPDGLCIPCADGEAGEALGRLDAGRRFDGYTDRAASDGKVLADVLARGDRWFRSGDLMRRDAAGFHYFVDRLGDTFRWKGENVSTAEVAGVMRGCPGVLDATVYGVRVPGQEGRAGMAAVVPAPGFDADVLAVHCAAHLPPYARPLFLRLCGSLDLTPTLKLTPGRFAAEGLEAGGDALLVRSGEAFVPFGPEVREAIAEGRVRV